MGSLYDHKLNAGELKSIVNRGETVIHGGRAVRSVDELPTDVDLAGNDTVKRQAALGDLQAQRDALDRQIAEAKGAAAAPSGDEATEEQGSVEGESGPGDEAVRGGRGGRRSG